MIILAILAAVLHAPALAAARQVAAISAAETMPSEPAAHRHGDPAAAPATHAGDCHGADAAERLACATVCAAACLAGPVSGPPSLAMPQRAGLPERVATPALLAVTSPPDLPPPRRVA